MSTPTPAQVWSDVETLAAVPGCSGEQQLARALLLLRGKEQPAPVAGDSRDPECVAAWPECYSGGYDPRCCRFPKSCSCGGSLQPAPADHVELIDGTRAQP